MRTVLGIDIGGTATKLAVVQPDGTITHQDKIPTEARGTDPEPFFTRLFALTDGLVEQSRDSLIGIVVGGGVLFAIAATYYRVRGEEGLGMGDVKLLAGTGLMLGFTRALGGVLGGLLLAGVVLVILLAARRIGRRSYVPFGPFLIIGALWAVLILQQS